MHYPGCFTKLVSFTYKSLLLAAGAAALTAVIMRLFNALSLPSYANGLFIAGLALMTLGGAAVLGGRGFSADPMTIYLRMRAGTGEKKYTQPSLMMAEIIESLQTMLILAAAGAILLLAGILLSNITGK